MLLVTPQQLVALYECPFVRAANFAPHINHTLWHYGIVTPARIRAFLAQIGHESGRLRWVREVWGPTDAQRRYERDFGATWPPTRSDQTNRLAWKLGNSEFGDGRRFCGRGLVQTTGRTNYTRLSAAMEMDFVQWPGLLESHEWACLSAGQYWDDHKLNKLADAEDMHGLTRKINGGTNGLADRMALYERAQRIIT